MHNVEYRHDIPDVEAVPVSKYEKQAVYKAISDSKQYDSLDGLRKFVANLGLLVEDGYFDLDEKLSINPLFPEVTPKKVRDVLTVWKSK
ncbi:hypothetical protein CEP54_014952 [Fusarium duplospermum]|uniref:Uncharacterized protein n=1 Tax=Fusarium duplospermum TaxID=1325734 RepID=A0A428NSL2_9HYPO|nr:hypothetical protein CEP54_014952 [Fusarium duplospermum]